MGIFGKILGIALPIVLVPLTGGASLAIQTALRSVLSAVGSQLIQKLGQALGLPQPIIDLGKAALAKAVGQPANAIPSLPQAIQSFSQVAGFTPSQEGEMQRGLEDQISAMVQDAVRNNVGFQDENGNKLNGRTTLKGDFFTRMAEMLGKKLNQSFDQLDKAADATNFKDTKAVTDFQAQQQKFAYFMTAVSGAIKTVGEALATGARKG